VREEIDRWVAKVSTGRKRSAVISALHAAQHENNGFLTPALMDAVAAYLGLPNIHVMRWRPFYSIVRDQARRTPPCVGMHQYFLHVARFAGSRRPRREEIGHQDGRKHAGWPHILESARGMPGRVQGCTDDDGDHIFHENLTPDSIDRILDELT